MDYAVTFSWTVLAILAYLSCHAVSERLLFHLTRAAADPVALRQHVSQWQRGTADGPPVHPKHLGWLRPLLRGARGNARDLLAACVCEQGQMLRFRDMLPMAGNVATATGLLASVLALHRTALATDPSAVIALGMVATIVGLLIAIPVTIYNGLFTARTERLVDQADLVITALEKVVFEVTPDKGAGSDDPGAGRAARETPALRLRLAARVTPGSSSQAAARCQGGSKLCHEPPPKEGKANAAACLARAEEHLPPASPAAQDP